jgi:hypothetical protein
LTSSFFTIIQFSLGVLRNTTELEQRLLEAIYTKVTGSFKSSQDVNADGFYAISTLVHYFPDR